MNRNEFEITDRSVIKEFLEEQTAGVLSLVDPRGGAYAVPMNYLYYDGRIIVHGALEGKKSDCINAESSVHFLVYQEYSFIPASFVGAHSPCNNAQFFKSVSLTGEARTITDLKEKGILLKEMLLKYFPESQKGEIRHPVEEMTNAIGQTIMIEIVPGSISSKFKFGQNLGDDRKRMIIENLIKRGTPLDLETVKMIERFAL